MFPNPLMLITLDDLVHCLLKRLQWTQNQLAAEIDVSPSAISRICHQKSGPKAEQIFVEHLLHYLDEPLEDHEQFFCREYLAWIEAYTGAWTTATWKEHWQAQWGELSQLSTDGVTPPVQKPTPRRELTSVTHNLPAPMTALIGRDNDVTTISNYLFGNESNAPRLITLTGPGGVGKTRLALACGWMLLDEFPDGIYWIELARLQSADLVVGAIAQSLQISTNSEDGLIELLKRRLGSRKVLLIIDNFEHLLDAVPLVFELLASCATVTMLVTSRKALTLYGEHEYVVAPLGTSTTGDDRLPATLSTIPSVKLFCARATAANRAFVVDDETIAAIADICITLDGLPLAIELAAAQMKYMTVNTLRHKLQRANHGVPRWLQSPLRNRDDRHQSVWATIAWSYSLLSADEQHWFRHLAIFVDGFTNAAAAHVCQQDDSPITADHLLRSLADKSLVRLQQATTSDSLEDNGEGTRYSLFEMMRHFGLEELEQRGELETAKQRHADYYLIYVESLDPQSEGRQNARMVRLIRLEYSNLRSAFSHYEQNQNFEACLRLCHGLHSYWNIVGDRDALTLLYTTEGLASPGLISPSFAELLASIGFYRIRYLGRLAGRAYIERALAMNMQTGNRANPKRIGMAYGMLAWICFYHDGDYVAAHQHFASAQANDEAAGDLWALAMTLVNRGQMAFRLGEYEKAEAFYQQSLALHQRNGDPWGLAMTLNNLAELHLRHRQLTTTVEFLDAAQVQIEPINSSDQLIQNHCLRAHLSLMQGDVAKAQVLLRQLFTETFTSSMRQYQLDRIRYLVPLAEQLQQPFHALTLAAAIAANLQAAQIILPPQDQPWLQEAIVRIRRQLTPEQRTQAEARGETFSMEETLAHAKMIVDLPLPEEGK